MDQYNYKQMEMKKMNINDGGHNKAGNYKKTFAESSGQKTNRNVTKENRFAFTFLIQSLVCVSIIGAIAGIKYAAPDTFISVSAAISGLYENNITLSDLNDAISENILQNDAVAAFFNITP